MTCCRVDDSALVEDAEREAGERIDRVILGITGPKVDSQLAEAEIELGQREISSKDVQKVWAKALGQTVPKERELLGAYPVMYGVDDQDDIRDAVGMIGERLRVLLNVVTAPKSLVKNLKECVQRAHLGVERIVPSALASGGEGSLALTTGSRIAHSAISHRNPNIVSTIS